MIQILYIFTAQVVILCSKDKLVVNEKPFDKKRIAKLSKDVLKGKVFGFAKVDTEIPDELYDKFNKIAPLFVVQEIPDCNIPEEMKMYKKKTSRRYKKVTGCNESKKNFFCRRL